MDDGVDLCDYPFQQSAIDIQGTGCRCGASYEPSSGILPDYIHCQLSFLADVTMRF